MDDDTQSKTITMLPIPDEVVDKIIDQGLQDHHGHGCEAESALTRESCARAAHKAAMASGSGPAKVSSPAFRAGWEAIFGTRTVGEA